jgi:hypothetical protein
MKVLFVLLLIASHHPSKHNNVPRGEIEQLQLPSIDFIMPDWCSVPHIDQYITRCRVFRI